MNLLECLNTMMNEYGVYAANSRTITAVVLVVLRVVEVERGI